METRESIPWIPWISPCRLVVASLTRPCKHFLRSHDTMNRLYESPYSLLCQLRGAIYSNFSVASILAIFK